MNIQEAAVICHAPYQAQTAASDLEKLYAKLRIASRRIGKLREQIAVAQVLLARGQK